MSILENFKASVYVFTVILFNPALVQAQPKITKHNISQMDFTFNHGDSGFELHVFSKRKTFSIQNESWSKKLRSPTSSKNAYDHLSFTLYSTLGRSDYNKFTTLALRKSTRDSQCKPTYWIGMYVKMKHSTWIEHSKEKCMDDVEFAKSILVQYAVKYQFRFNVKLYNRLKRKIKDIVNNALTSAIDKKRYRDLIASFRDGQGFEWVKEKALCQTYYKVVRGNSIKKEYTRILYHKKERKFSQCQAIYIKPLNPIQGTGFYNMFAVYIGSRGTIRLISLKRRPRH